jgi:hypothetical protein
MAKLIPTFNSCASDMTGGEKRLGQSLEDNLEDDYFVRMKSSPKIQSSYKKNYGGCIPTPSSGRSRLNKSIGFGG